MTRGEPRPVHITWIPAGFMVPGSTTPHWQMVILCLSPPHNCMRLLRGSRLGVHACTCSWAMTLCRRCVLSPVLINFMHALRLNGNFAPLARLERDAVAASRFVERPHKRVRAGMLGAAFEPPQDDSSTSRQRPRFLRRGLGLLTPRRGHQRGLQHCPHQAQLA